MSETVLQFFLDMLNCVIGVFGGFVFALFLQHRTDRKNREDKIKLVISSVTEELNDISSTLEQYVNMRICLNCRIQTPSWDSVLYSGIALELIEKPIYIEIIKVYSLIKSFNEERVNRNDSENITSIVEIINAAKCITDKYDSKIVI